MALRPKRTRRWLILLSCLGLLLSAGGAAYFVRVRQLERRIQQGRVDGLAALKAEDYQKAAEKLGGYLKRYPKDTEALYGYAEAQRNVTLSSTDPRQLTQALSAYRRLVDQSAAYPD